jgi:hypothetical protein
MSFGLAPGPEVVELFGDAQLVLDRRGDALHLEAVAQRGVEDLDEPPGGRGHERCHGELPRNERAAPMGGSTNTWEWVHVFYTMMMMTPASARKARRSCVIVAH